MTTQVHIGENLVEKRFSTPAAAGAALSRARELARAGIATPLPIATDDVTLRFLRLRGTSGPDLIAALPDLLAPLAALTQLRAPSLTLAPHDPLRRIRPRLALVTPAVATLAFRQIARLPYGATNLCHGDFHPGQVIRDAEGCCWLLDLDDLALGPPEADLGNLVAWLATRPANDRGPLAPQVDHWRSAVVSVWSRLRGRVDPSALEAYLTLALIRRALKRAETGDRRILDALETQA